MARRGHALDVPALHMLQHCSATSTLLASTSSAPSDPGDKVARVLTVLANVASDTSYPKAQRRDAIVAIAQLAEHTAHSADRLRLYKLVVQALREPDTSWQPWFAAAVMRLAQALAACCCLEASPPRPTAPLPAQGKSSSSGMPGPHSSVPLPAPGQPSSRGMPGSQAPAYGGVLVPTPPSSSSALQPASSAESGELPLPGSPEVVPSAGVQVPQGSHDSKGFQSQGQQEVHVAGSGEGGYVAEAHGAACPASSPSCAAFDAEQDALLHKRRRVRLQPTQASQQGPGLAAADINMPSLDVSTSAAAAGNNMPSLDASTSAAAAGTNMPSLDVRASAIAAGTNMPSLDASTGAAAASPNLPSMHASTSTALGPLSLHQTSDMMQPPPGDTTQPAPGGATQQVPGDRGVHRKGRALPWAHASSLQRGLLAWCGHWHPRVRRAALAALLAAHDHQPHQPRHTPKTQEQPQQQSAQQQGAQQLQQDAQQQHQQHQQQHQQPQQDAQQQQQHEHQQCQQPSQDLQHDREPQQPNQEHQSAQGKPKRGQAQTTQQKATRGCCVCISNACAMGSYNAAVLALGDDHEGVRMVALQLLFVLARGHPRLHLQEPHFWQFSRPQTMADDAFQRLCSAAANDPEMGVRRAALQWLQGLHGAGLRVKLQALNKKAIVRAEVPAAGESALPGKGQKKGKGKQQQGAVFTGRMGGGPWAGSQSTHSLDLLDASMGALVHSTEDELGQVRAAAAGALAALGVSELLALGKVLQPAAAVRGSKDGKGAGQRNVDTDSDVIADRRQAACQSAEYLVDLLHDEVQAVREAAAQGLLQLARHARPTFQAAKQPHGRRPGVPEVAPFLHGTGCLAPDLSPGPAQDPSAVPGPLFAPLAPGPLSAPPAMGTPAAPGPLLAPPAPATGPDPPAAQGQLLAPESAPDPSAATGPLLVVLLDRDQTRALISALSDPAPLVRSCMRASLPLMCLATPAVLQSLILGLTQNAASYPAEAEDARSVAKAAAACAPAHIIGPTLSKMVHQAQKQRQELPQQQLQWNEQLSTIVQAMKETHAVLCSKIDTQGSLC